MPPNTVRLATVIADLDPTAVHGDPAGTDVTAVTHDSRAVVPGALFCCVPGRVRDGHDFAPDAVAAGAAALLCERRLSLEIVQVEVRDVRRQMGRAAAAFHGHPSRDLRVVGVTGTNGKTTVTHLLHAVLEAHGWPTGLLGTLSGPRTTPESTDLQATLARFRREGVEAVAMEVSSHALALHRVEGTWFTVAVFTNLSRDHLDDFHGDMESYFRAKASLFDPARAAVGVVNVDDPHGRLLVDAAALPVRTYSLADVSDLDVGPTRSTFTWEGQPIVLPLGGAFNVSNAVAAATAARELGVAPAAVAEGLARARPPAGRFEPVDAGQPFTALVDYAHTPDALEHLLSAVRAATDGRVIVVFGCGGDRDRAKRPAMGQVASTLADVVVLTSDNPRSEAPEAIAAEIAAGAVGGADVRTELDRAAAIRVAVAAARPGDAVVVAGKGHETTQTFADRVVPFDDHEVLAGALAELRETAGW